MYCFSLGRPLFKALTVSGKNIDGAIFKLQLALYNYCKCYIYMEKALCINLSLHANFHRLLKTMVTDLGHISRRKVEEEKSSEWAIITSTWNKSITSEKEFNYTNRKDLHLDKIL